MNPRSSLSKRVSRIRFQTCAVVLAMTFLDISINAQTPSQLLTAELKEVGAQRLAVDAVQKGNAQHGKIIFRSEKLACTKCHTVNLPGTTTVRSVGPDQGVVGDRLTAEQIVESLLSPNQTIAKGFETTLVVTVDGDIYKGVSVSQSRKEVVLADPEKKDPITIARKDIEAIKDAPSLMPEGLVDQLASQQDFYDLIKYLTQQKASNTGVEIESGDTMLVKEIPQGAEQLPLLAVSRPDGICYVYDPNAIHFQSIWEGPLGWQHENGHVSLNQASAELFHIRSQPWKIDVGKVLFDHHWVGYEVGESDVVFKYTLTDKEEGRVWLVNETIEILSESRQRIHFKLTPPDQSNNVLTYWLEQTNYRNVTTNGQQAQRNQLEFLKPGQTEFTLDLSRRKKGQTIPRGYSVSRIDTPKPTSPYLFEPTSFSFAADGTAFVSTRTGGIWRFKEGVWNLFADGLLETLGVKVAPNGRDVYTMQKPELTLLQDTDSDGRADLYQSVENRFRFTGQYHEFAYGPVMNSGGDLFFSTGLSSSGNHQAKDSGTGQMSSALGYRGWVMKQGRDGNLVPFASGLRSPAGIGMNADDELFVTDNQGDWVASSYLGHVEEGDFLGHPATLWDREEYAITPRVMDYKTVNQKIENVPPLDDSQFAKIRKRPAVWLIHGDLTNSPGNPAFCPPTGFGPFAGQAFIADISHRAIVRVALEKINGVFQGAVFPFIRPLASASYSTRFDPQGRLWIGSVGRGWTAGDPMIEVISYDDKKTPFEIHRVNLRRDGFDVHFTQPLALQNIPPDQVTVRQFHYLYWKEYGSDRQGNVRIPVESLRVSPDRKMLSIKLPVAKDNVYELDFGTLFSAERIELQNNFAFYTLNELAR